jgi:threonine aldolase
MDGARIFNASVFLGTDVASLTRACDSVMFCLSKGLAAPVGSMLLGSRDFIDRARSVRKLLGGGMRQAGILAAAGLIALEQMPARLVEDHRNARLLADLLREVPGLKVEPERVRTNILMAEIVQRDRGADRLAARLRQDGVLVSVLDTSRMRLVTHKDVNHEQIFQAAGIMRQALQETTWHS